MAHHCINIGFSSQLGGECARLLPGVESEVDLQVIVMNNEYKSLDEYKVLM